MKDVSLVSPFTKRGLKNTIYFFRFVKGAMNIIDLLGILPYFMSLLLNLITVSGNVLCSGVMCNTVHLDKKSVMGSLVLGVSKIT